MKKEERNYSLVLSSGQARFLATSKYGIDRMKAFMSLVELASTENRTYEKKGFSTAIHVGQLVISEVELSRLWKCDRKTVSKVLDMMNEQRLLSTRQNNRTSIHTLLCISAWYVDGQEVVNPYFVPMKEDSLPVRGSVVGKSTNAHPSTNADATAAPAQTEQNHAPSSVGELPSEQALEAPKSMPTDSPYIYNKVEGTGDNSESPSDKSASGVNQQKDNTKPKGHFSPPIAQLMDIAHEILGDKMFGDANSIYVAKESAPEGNANDSGNKTPPPAGSTSDIGLTPDSVPDGAYHSMRDLQIDRLNQLGK